MRILIVTDQYPPMIGGVPTVTRALAAALAQRGHAVNVLAPSQDRHMASGSEGSAGVAYLGSVPWPLYPGARLAGLPFGAVSALMDSFRPQVVHIHSPLVLGVLARRAAGQRGIPVVYTNHYLPVNAAPWPTGRSSVAGSSFYAYVVGFSNRCTHVTAPSRTALRLLRERGLHAPARVVSNGADLAAFAPGPPDDRLRARLGLPAGRPLVLSVSRLSPEKRVSVLIEAARRLAGRAHVVIAGTGPQEARLRAQAQRLGLGGRVTFLGFVPGPELPGLYRLADVFAVPSEAELQGLATMDAMASGLPVVAADACALGELVSHGGNGLLFRPGDSGQLAACLDTLTARPRLRARMAAESLRAIAGHDYRRSVTAWESLYRSLEAAGSGGRP